MAKDKPRKISDWDMYFRERFCTISPFSLIILGATQMSKQDFAKERRLRPKDKIFGVQKCLIYARRLNN